MFGAHPERLATMAGDSHTTGLARWRERAQGIEEILDALRAHRVLVDKPAELQKSGFGLADTISI
jgi:chemotaxis protein histidine kinase CheA